MVLLGALCALCALAQGALAARVIVFGAHGRATVRNDRFLTTPALTPAPLAGGHAARAAAARAAAAQAARAARAHPRAQAADRNVRTELARLRRRHAISTAAYRRYLGSFNAALGTVGRIRGTRAFELEAGIQNIHR